MKDWEPLAFAADVAGQRVARYIALAEQFERWGARDYSDRYAETAAEAAIIAARIGRRALELQQA